MRTALYYPYTRVRSEGLLRTALLLWDRLEYISPSAKFAPEYEDRKLAEAAEIVCRPYVPTDDDRKIAFKQLEALNSQRLPSWFYLDDDSKDHLDLHYGKVKGADFLSLKISALARPVPEGPKSGRIIRMRSAMGLSVMAILAECCAGTQKATITDETDSYAVLNRYITLAARGSHSTKPVDDAYLVTLPFITLDGANVKLKHLVALRQREARGDYGLSDLRHRYAGSLEKHMELMKTAAKPSDRKEIERAFIDDIKTDLKFLKDELRVESIDTLLSKDIGIAFLTAATALASFASGYYPAVGIGAAGSLAALAKAWNKIRGTRAKVMKSHPWAYLYFVKK